MRSLILALLLGAVLAPPAHAQVEPFPGRTWVIPGVGFVWRASSWPAAQPSQMFDFTVYLDEYEELPEAIEVEVARGPELDADGTLADAGVIDRYEARPVAGYPAIYSARTRVEAQWVATPGTYYWQASYEEYEDQEEELYATPVRSLAIVPAPPPDAPTTGTFLAPAAAAPAVLPAATAAPAPLAASTARIIVRQSILAATHRSHRGVTYRCATAPAAATCQPSWRDLRYRYRGTLRIVTGVGGITASFAGTRTTRACERRCARSLTWTVTL